MPLLQRAADTRRHLVFSVAVLVVLPAVVAAVAFGGLVPLHRRSSGGLGLIGAQEQAGARVQSGDV